MIEEAAEAIAVLSLEHCLRVSTHDFFRNKNREQMIVILKVFLPFGQSQLATSLGAHRHEVVFTHVLR